MQHQDFLFPEDREKHKRSLVYNSPEFKAAYAKYISSAQWKRIGLDVRARARRHCERCRNPERSLEIHHLTYERFQNELPRDLLAVCKTCHFILDREREKKNEQAFEEIREASINAAKQNSYFTAIYGEGWHDHFDADPEGLSERYNSWNDKNNEEGYQGH